ncbi:MAG: hypothetical protein LUE29_01520 [Lachnospiraceae bacterium]|nr:hypothetical protein [Lachnospiraceae bacterium]
MNESNHSSDMQNMDDLLKSNGFSPEKIAFLEGLTGQANGKSPRQLLPLLMQATTLAKSSGIDFTDDETALLIHTLMPDMTPEDQKRLNMMRMIAARMAGSGRSS